MDDVELLIERVKAGDFGAVRAMLAGNFLLSSQRLPSGESPLMTAAYRGHSEIVEALIESGADIDIFAAAATGRVADLQRAATTDPTNGFSYDGWTALHLAAFFGHVEAARVLIQLGADVHAVSRNSLTNTPLHAAAAGRHAAVALLLLEHGASASATDAGGYTAAEIARQNGLDDVVTRIG